MRRLPLERGPVDFAMGRGMSSMAYQAAHLGLGVAIGQKFLVDDDLRAGSLVMPFDLLVHLKETYYFLSSPRYVGVSKLEAFREWVLEEANTNAVRSEQSAHSA